MAFFRPIFWVFLLFHFPFVYASNQTLDELFRAKTLKLEELVHTNNVANLIAQMSPPNTSTNDVNEMNEFIAIGVSYSPDGKAVTWITTFDKEQNIIKQLRRDEPWIGVNKFNQEDIPALSFQDGLQLARTCLTNQNNAAQITRFVLFKTIQTQQIVYDYVFNDESTKPLCQEVLLTPVTGQCQLGMQVACYFDFSLGERLRSP